MKTEKLGFVPYTKWSRLQKTEYRAWYRYRVLQPLITVCLHCTVKSSVNILLNILDCVQIEKQMMLVPARRAWLTAGLESSTARAACCWGCVWKLLMEREEWAGTHWKKYYCILSRLWHLLSLIYWKTLFSWNDKNPYQTNKITPNVVPQLSEQSISVTLF